jgi:cellulose synthase/poly-beta-1,6-N-acetylglucosamine synthase-like glycosyltransferase
MISFIITSYKEPETIKVALSRILDKSHNNLPENCEIITVIPDEPTIQAAQEAIMQYKFNNWVNIKDPFLGKPYALNLAFQKAQGEIWILTDGDVYIENDSVPKLLEVLNSNENIAGVSGHPICEDDRRTLFGYWGRLLSNTAHKGRLSANKKGDPYLLSGYLMAIRKLDFQIPDGVLDDAYITYKLVENGFKVRYASQAKVIVKYPQNFNDFMKQKVRNLIGFKYTAQKINIKDISKQRSLTSEFKYFFVPLQFAQSSKEVFYSCLLYPVRLLIWIKTFYTVKFSKSSMTKVWQRVESTK